MGLETTATTVSSLDITYPEVGDNVSQGDDHLRLIKRSLTNTFPDLTATVSCASAELLFAKQGGTVSGNAMISGTLTVEGISTFKLGISTNSSIHVGTSLTVSAGAVIKGGLTVSGNAVVAGSLSVSGNATVGGKLIGNLGAPQKEALAYFSCTAAGTSVTALRARNVTSVSRSGTGIYKVNFSGNFSTIYYVAVASLQWGSASVGAAYAISKAVGSVKIKCATATKLFDTGSVNLLVWE